MDGMEGVLTTNCSSCSDVVSLDEMSRLRDLSCPSCRKPIVEIPKLTDPALVVVRGDGELQISATIDLSEEVSFGRAQANTITLREMKASRQHAVIKNNGVQYVIKDLKSANGTFVNDQLVNSRVLSSGDLLRIADTVLLFSNPLERISVTSRLGTRISDAAYETQAEVKFSDHKLELSMFSKMGGLDSSSADISRLKKANEKLSILYEVTNHISSVLDQSQLLERVLDVVFEHIPAERGAIFLRGESGELEQRVVKKRGEEVEDRYLEISKTIIKKVVDERTSILSTDTMQDESFSHAHSIISQGIRQAMSVPLICREELLGLLHIDTTRMSRAFDQDNLQLLTGIAGQAAIAIQNARLMAQIEEEIQTRSALSRYLAPELVDQVVNKQLDFEMGGQEKKCTVLFSDIRGFTPMSERISAVTVVDTLNRYYEVMVDTIFKHGGMLDKFIGDAIMAVWGLPIEQPQDALKAVRAAIEMQVQLYLLNYGLRQEGREELFMGVGINSGDVVSGNMGSTKRREYTVIGPAVNLAARIESLTKQHQVLISENTYREIQPYVRALELEPTTVKGIQGEIQVYCVMGVVPEVSDPESGEQGDASRLDVFFPVQLVSPENGTELDGVTVNISSEGLAVEVIVSNQEAVTEGSVWGVTFDIYGLEKLSGSTGRVVHLQTIAEEGSPDLIRVGLDFERVDESVERFFRSHLFADVSV